MSDQWLMAKVKATKGWRSVQHILDDDGKPTPSGDNDGMFKVTEWPIKHWALVMAGDYTPMGGLMSIMGMGSQFDWRPLDKDGMLLEPIFLAKPGESFHEAVARSNEAERDKTAKREAK